MSRIYLDNNATTPIDPDVLNTLTSSYQSCPGNPSSIHSFGQEAKKSLTDARKKIAAYLGVMPSEIIFNSGGTEGGNSLIKGWAGVSDPGHVITSNTEHSCVQQSLLSLEKQGYEVSWLPSGMRGVITPKQVEDAIRPDTKLIALMAVNNETGVMLDVAGVAQIAHSHNIPLIIDGVALLGKESFTVPAGVSAMFFSGHKIHAPKGTGFSFIRRSFKVAPLLCGGGQEFGKRCGTENLPGIEALGHAVDLLNDKLPKSTDAMRTLRDHFEQSLISTIEGVVINGEGPRVSNTSNLAFMDVDGESLLMNLDLEGVAASHGSACASGALEPSRVLLNMGIPYSQATSSIRFSVSRMTTKEDVDRAIAIICKLVHKLRGSKRSVTT